MKMIGSDGKEYEAPESGGNAPGMGYPETSTPVMPGGGPPIDRTPGSVGGATPAPMPDGGSMVGGPPATTVINKFFPRKEPASMGKFGRTPRHDYEDGGWRDMRKEEY